MVGRICRSSRYAYTAACSYQGSRAEETLDVGLRATEGALSLSVRHHHALDIRRFGLLQMASATIFLHDQQALALYVAVACWYGHDVSDLIRLWPILFRIAHESLLLFRDQ